MKIYVVRHGQTDWNVLKLCQGQINIPLNEKGIEQAKITKEKLENEKIDLIITSPLDRAKNTAKIINEDRDLQVIEDERLVERDLGEYERAKIDSFDHKGFWDYNCNYKYKKAENIRDFCYRIKEAMEEYKEKYKGKNILLSTHGGVTMAMYIYFNGVPEDDLRSHQLENCEFVCYEID